MADHEDYLEEGAAVAHHETHEDEGADEISLAGLSGEPEDLAAHILLPTVHQNAPGLIETHRLVPGAHHAKYTNAEAVTAMGAKADVNPLHHDKAAEWGATEHTAIGDGAPHHAKYTDGEAVAAMGAKADVNPLHHDKAAEWGATEHTAIGDGAPHHAKYTNAEAVAAMGAKADVNPLHHDKAAEWGATEHTAIGDAAPHHAKYTDGDARGAINDIIGSDGKADEDIDLDTHKLLNVVDPVANQQAATKKYVDDKIAGVGGKIKFGTYEGDGTTSNAITGVGFAPKFVFIISPGGDNVDQEAFFRFESYTGDLATQLTGSHLWGRNNKLISLDTDGFTVDDDGMDYFPNQDGVTFSYIALG